MARKPHSQETKDKIRESNLRTWSSETKRQEHSALMKGKKKAPMKPEHRKKRSKWAKDKNIVRNLRAYWKKPENKLKQSERVKLRFTDPAERTKASETTKAGMADPDVKKQLSISAKKRLERPGEMERLAAVRAKGQYIAQTRCPTSLEKAVMTVLEDEGYDFIFQFQIGPYLADFAIGNIILEADGEPWHRDKARERKRDGFLKSKGFVVIHLSDKSIKSNARVAVLDALKAVR